MGTNDNNANWLQLLRELERTESEMYSQGGDTESLKDLDFILKYPNQAANITEARVKRKTWEARIRMEAAKAKAAITQAKERAKVEGLKAYAIANAELLVLSINGERVKWKNWDGLKCPTCGEPSEAVQGIALEVAEDLQHFAEHIRAGRGTPPFKIRNSKCSKCGKELTIRAQGVIL